MKRLRFFGNCQRNLQCTQAEVLFRHDSEVQNIFQHVDRNGGYPEGPEDGSKKTMGGRLKQDYTCKMAEVGPW